MKTMRKIVVKVGTSTLTQGAEMLSREFMLGLVEQMAHLKTIGIEIVLVTSGAVATGKSLLGSHLSPSKQTLASVGQVKLMQLWSELFSLFDLQVGQVLLTKEDFSHAKQQHTHNTLSCLLTHHIIPIINENDTTSTKESCVGNNDSLAALVGHVIKADALILLTDQEGFYTADPRLTPEATLIPIVEYIDENIFSLAGGSSTTLGTGGMTTKIKAAQIAGNSGIQTIITSSSRPNVLIDLAHGKQIGTLFLGNKIL